MLLPIRSPNFGFHSTGQVAPGMCCRCCGPSLTTMTRDVSLSARAKRPFRFSMRYSCQYRARPSLLTTLSSGVQRNSCKPPLRVAQARIDGCRPDQRTSMTSMSRNAKLSDPQATSYAIPLRQRILYDIVPYVKARRLVSAFAVDQHQRDSFVQ